MLICVNGAHILLATNAGIVASILPDYCWTDKTKTVKLPFYIVAFCQEAIHLAPTFYGDSITIPAATTTTSTTTTTTPSSPAVSLPDYAEGHPALTRNSRIPRCYGDEGGAGGGEKSGVNNGWCIPRDHSPTVSLMNYEVLKDGCYFDMNCATENSDTGNTLGQATYAFGLSSDIGNFIKGEIDKSANIQETLSALRCWAELLNYAPPEALIEQYKAASPGLAFQDPASGSGRTNFDFYAVEVDKLPGKMTPQDLLNVFRYETDKLHPDNDDIHFEPHPDDPDGKNGRLIQISLGWLASILPHKRGSVLASDIVTNGDRGYFRFSTVTTGDDGTHPVNGTREFGYYRTGKDSYTFYTSAVDRSHDWTSRGFLGYLADAATFSISGTQFGLRNYDAYSQGHKLWRSMQETASEFINGLGGEARIGHYISERFEIDFGCE